MAIGLLDYLGGVELSHRAREIPNALYTPRKLDRWLTKL